MALYLDKNTYALLASPDLKSWTKLQEFELPDATECPDFFPLAVDGDAAEVKWVFWGANGTYLVGRFDGATYTPEQPAQRYDWCDRATYAAQTWSDIPQEDRRRIQIAWMRVPMPGDALQPVHELSLRADPAPRAGGHSPIQPAGARDRELASGIASLARSDPAARRASARSQRRTVRYPRRIRDRRRNRLRADHLRRAGEL